jgi:heme/copper-type cytochrome/quinol oxidase subunit 2
VLSVAARFYVRLGVQKQITIDDGFLIVALCCLISAMSIMYSVTIDRMYLAEAVAVGLPGVDLPPDFLQQAFDFQKWVTITLTLLWCAVMAVKFSFLFFFRKLIDRIRPLIIYWWVVTVFNVAVLGYGSTVYYLACPHYYSIEACKLNQGENNGNH